MLFYEPIFLIFFPVLYVLYLVMHGKNARNWTLLAGSLNGAHPCPDSKTGWPTLL